jgi:hypothetical protein
MPAFPRDDETVLGKLSDKRVYNMGHLARLSENSPLSFIGSPEFEHLRGYLQLFKTAKPIGDGLKLTNELVKLVPQRRRRP